ncbi:C1-like protein [Corchorus olitorius]|uniref:C1-like protein n=1 Tax=Corchorus olitorius TaxID=93759 RepID=A0A1R3IAJ0_9ROSI|nr:C1-like protein [Corchorus olitorius]
MEHGCYYCSDCKIVAHVNCATKYNNWYYAVEEENEDDDSLELDPITITKMNDAGEATEIKHFKHEHNLMLGGVEIVEYDDKCCDGCILPISPPYFRCSECNFFLHKGCAELPKKKEVWFHYCQKEVLNLISDYIFSCITCDDMSNGFGYKCEECEKHVCFKCVSTLTGQPARHTIVSVANLLYVLTVLDCQPELNTNAIRNIFLLSLMVMIMIIQLLITVTYVRIQEIRLYCCGTCDTCAYVKCDLGEHSFIKIGSVYKQEDGDYPHPLTFIKKMYYYPKCFGCDEPCQDLALECSQPGCNYITH